jgi:hypothetical protein
MAPGRALQGAVLTQLPGSPNVTSTTNPGNGDGNPYGVAFVPEGFPSGGPLEPGDVLVSNFNSSSGFQGTGTTIARITPGGSTSLFFQAPGSAGLTTALGVLRAGFVVVGNLPTSNNGTTIGQGSLFILNRHGGVVMNLTNSTLLDGPWDLAVVDGGFLASVFVSNVRSGTVTRLDLFLNPIVSSVTVLHMTQIASGYTHGLNNAALVVGPTGLAFDPSSGLLYVASTADNEIFSVQNALFRTTDGGTGSVVFSDNDRLRGPLGLVLAPNGDLITANGDAINTGGLQNELVEFTRQGQFVTRFQVDPGAGGAAFGIAIAATDGHLRFAAVDDNTNSVTVWKIQ